MQIYDVITFGSASRDVYLLGLKYDKHQDKHFRTGRGICFPWGAKVNIPEIFYTSGGGGTNSAVTFARQGYKTAAVVRVGDDVRGGEICRELEANKVHAKFVQKDPKVATAYSAILLTPGGERTILANRGAGEEIDAKQVPWNGIKPKWVYLDSLHRNTDILKGVINWKKKFGTKIAWNPGGSDLSLGHKTLKKYLSHVDIFTANQEEISELVGVPYGKPKKIFAKYDALFGGIAVMTMGPKGVMVSDGKNLWQAGVYRERKIVDRTGAGDSFGSGFTAAYAKKQNIEYAISFASANATSKVENLGAKGGLLRKNQFERERRWKNLKITVRKLN